MYFESRSQAGAKLAERLVEEYRYEDSAVLALTNGSVLVGEQIAWRLHCVLMLLMSDILYGDFFQSCIVKFSHSQLIFCQSRLSPFLTANLH